MPKANFFVETLFLDRDLWDEKGSSKKVSRQIWGYYSKYKDAHKCVTENWTDIYDHGAYNLAAIHKLGEGMCVHVDDSKWFSVTAIINHAELARREDEDKAWKEAWDRASFFGKTLGDFMYRHLLKIDYDLGTTERELECLVGSVKYVAESIKMPWNDLYKIQAGDAAPVFTAHQWSDLRDLLELSGAEETTLKEMQLQALRDSETHGKPVSLYRHGSVKFTSADAPFEAHERDLIQGYTVEEMERPNAFKHRAFHL